MKQLISLALILLLLTGCAVQTSDTDRALQLRAALLSAAGCSFQAEITADYGDKIYTFTLDCSTDKDGNLCFTVLQPEYIADIQGEIRYEGGALTFDDVALAFELQADGLLSPVSAPWVLLRALRSGYIRNTCIEQQLLRISINDSYQEDALMVDIWVDENNRPLKADIYEENRRILALSISNFVIV